MLIKENEKLKTEKANNRKQMMYGAGNGLSTNVGGLSGNPPQYASKFAP